MNKYKIVLLFLILAIGFEGFIIYDLQNKNKTLSTPEIVNEYTVNLLKKTMKINFSGLSENQAKEILDRYAFLSNKEDLSIYEWFELKNLFLRVESEDMIRTYGENKDVIVEIDTAYNYWKITENAGPYSVTELLSLYENINSSALGESIMSDLSNMYLENTSDFLIVAYAVANEEFFIDDLLYYIAYTDAEKEKYIEPVLSEIDNAKDSDSYRLWLNEQHLSLIKFFEETDSL